MGLFDWFRRLGSGSGAAPPQGPPPPGGPLSPEALLASKLWFDQDDALSTIESMLDAGTIDADKAENLKHFVERGYMVIDLDLDPSVFEAMDRDVERLWTEKPDNVAYAYHSLLTRFSDSQPEHRKPSCRIADMHTWSDAARSLFLNRKVFEYIDLLFGETAVATQSLYFEWGSQQGLHRDPVYVQMTPPSHLLATWLALEDIGPDCGPLVYMPGSHRLPYFQFDRGRFTVDFSRDSQELIQQGEAWDQRHCQDAGLELETLTCKRGQVLIWHHSLLHGGSLPTNPELTRKSFVVHYSTLSTMKRTQNSYVDTPGKPQVTHLMCERILEEGGRHGFDSPLNVASEAQSSS